MLIVGEGRKERITSNGLLLLYCVEEMKRELFFFLTIDIHALYII